jgi:hypothetical protein
LLPPWSRYKGASKLAHSKDFAIFETDADSHFRLNPIAPPLTLLK